VVEKGRLAASVAASKAMIQGQTGGVEQVQMSGV
jgi:hypothetical protein